MSTSKHNDVSFRIEDNRGRFIKPCPGTPRYVCCGYRIINIAQGCTLDCSYCVLDDYFASGTPVLFRNVDTLVEELSHAISGTKGIIRFGTGEFTDSLLHEAYLPVYERIFPLIISSSNAVIELKTKTTHTERIPDMEIRDRILVAWSLNSHEVASREEQKAPTVEQRMGAARNVESRGYKLAFHFDPIVYYKGWERGYRDTIDMLFSSINAKNVAYVSMGSLRFSPRVKDSLMRRSSLYLQGDFIRGLDGKMRYFRPQRTVLYRTVLGYLKRYIPEEKVYLCMENGDVWRDVWGIDGMTSAKLSQRLDNACMNVFTSLQRGKPYNPDADLDHPNVSLTNCGE